MRESKPLTKEEKEQRAKDLKERKERDKAKNLKYEGCPYCGKSTFWQLPKGVEDTPENIEKFKPRHCRGEECAKRFMTERQKTA